MNVEINNEILVSIKKLFNTTSTTLELVSELVLQEKKVAIEKRTADRGNFCCFYNIGGIDFYLYSITDEEVTTINQVVITERVKESEIWKFGYINDNNEIVMLYKNSFVADGQDQLKSIFKLVKEYCVGKGVPFAMKK